MIHNAVSKFIYNLHSNVSINAPNADDARTLTSEGLREK